MSEWPSFSVAELQREGVLLVEDGNHGQYRPLRDEFVNGGVAYVRAADMVNGQVDFEHTGGINADALARIRKGVGRPGDILFSHKGTVGKLARVAFGSPPFVCSPQTTFWRVLDHDRLSRAYLYAYMRSRVFIQQWWACKGSTDMADYVSLTDQRRLRVSLPPLVEQKRIAATLVILDDLIENNRRRIEVLEQMAQAIYREWFVRFRYPGHEHATFVDSPLGPIPEGWSVTTVGLLATLAWGDTSKTKASYEASGYVAYSASGPDGFMSTVDHYGEGVVISAIGAQCGKTWFANGSWSCIKNTLWLKGIVPLDTRYLYFATNERDFWPRRGAAQPFISLGDARTALVLAPPESLRLRFASAVEPSVLGVVPLFKWSASLVALRDFLLPKLVSGQIDVSGLDLDLLLETVA